MTVIRCAGAIEDMVRISVRISGIFMTLTAALALAAPELARAANLTASWADQGPVQTLGTWSAKDLTHSFKRVSSKEKDLLGNLTRWSGVLLQDVLDKALASLPPETKAQVDLVVLKTESGAQALIPRSVITKFPLMIATERESKALNGLQLVIPWSSKPKIAEESLPLETYFVAGITQLELANYKSRYASLYLKRRTDPSAMRGEKIFVQNCMGCHSGDGGGGVKPRTGPGHFASVADVKNEAKVRSLASSGHPPVKGNPKLSERDQRALMSYLDAYRSENSVAPQSQTTHAQAQTQTAAKTP